MTLRHHVLLSIFSLLPLIGYTNQDSVRVHDLLRVVDMNRNDSALAYGNNAKAMAIAKASGQEILVADAMTSLGTLYYAYGNYDSNIVYWEAARDIYQKAGDTINWAKTERLIGVHLDIHGEIQKSLEKFMLCRDLYKAANFRKGLGESYISISIMQQRLERHAQALESSRLALDIAISEKNEKMLGSIYNNMGSQFNSLHEYDSAEKYFKLALYEQDKNKNTSGLAMTYHNLGTLELSRNNYRKALVHYQKSVALKEMSPESDDALSSALSISLCYIHLNILDSAETILQEVLVLSKKNENLMRTIEAYKFLADLEEKKGDYKKSLGYFKEHMRLNDSANKILVNQTIQALEAKLEVNKTRDQNDELIRAQAENEVLLEENRKGIYALITLTVLLLLLIGVLYFMLRNLSRSRVKLKELNAELIHNTERLEENNLSLEKLMNSKNDLVSVMAHDLRSPFGKIQSITQLIEMSSDEKEKESYLRMLENITHDGMALIQDLIDLSRIELNEISDEHLKRLSAFNFTDIFNQLKVSFESHLKTKNLEMQLDLSEQPVMNRADYCERICDNIVSNAIKYSNPNGVIKIKSRVDGDTMKILIEDNGPGFKKKDMPGLFQRFSRLSARPTGIETSTGLGLYIAKKLAESIRGDIHLLSKENEPARFCVEIPMNLKHKLEAQPAA
ncbi:MAG: ATP-binding protein [Bacteroidia bacterium]